MPMSPLRPDISALIQANTAGSELTLLPIYMQKTNRIFALNEAADQMGRNESFVRRAVRAGLIRPVAGLRRLMISETELQRFLTTTEPYTPRHRPGKKAEVAK